MYCFFVCVTVYGFGSGFLYFVCWESVLYLSLVLFVGFSFFSWAAVFGCYSWFG